MLANGREFVSACFACFAVKSPLKKPPGEGTGPTRHADLRGNLVGRVPPRGEPDVFQQAANWAFFNSIQNLLPLPSADSTPTRPARRSTPFWTMARPMPVPG